MSKKHEAMLQALHCLRLECPEAVLHDVVQKVFDRIREAEEQASKLAAAHLESARRERDAAEAWKKMVCDEAARWAAMQAPPVLIRNAEGTVLGMYVTLETHNEVARSAWLAYGAFFAANARLVQATGKKI